MLGEEQEEVDIDLVIGEIAEDHDDGLEAFNGGFGGEHVGGEDLGRDHGVVEGVGENLSYRM